MKISFLPLLALIGCLLFAFTEAMALHHEPQNSEKSGLPNNEGKVLTIIDTTGYTYMELENGTNKFWIAAPTTQVNKGDHIRFSEEMVMTNYTSKTLNRTFSTLIFVSSIQVRR